MLLPSDPRKWTGRLQAIGGSAYEAGDLNSSGLAVGIKQGYVTTTTDAGDTSKASSYRCVTE